MEKTSIKKSELLLKRIRQKLGGMVSNFGEWIINHSDAIAMVIMLAIIMVPKIIFADESNQANDMWNDVMTEMKNWVFRLGGVVVFVGGIMFGLGFKNDDAEQKTRGVNTMVAGGIVAAMAVLADNLLIK